MKNDTLVAKYTTYKTSLQARINSELAPYKKAWDDATTKLDKSPVREQMNKLEKLIQDIYKGAGQTYTYTPYKTGGIADFTGPAWLDGTKSHPELVLNARDTENFIQLKEVLSSLLSGSSSSMQNPGDTYFDVHIDVEKISNDYDVEQLSNKVKQLIADEARYRNNNLINLMR